MDSLTLVTQMRDLGIWPDDEPMRRALLALPRQLPDPRALARELLHRNLLTPYQANQLLAGKGRDLAVGSYVLQERLGEGGMGQVFKARHAKLGRTVALKLIRPEHAKKPLAVQRFLREVEAAARLAHPNIVRAYDADQSGDTFYFAMQYIDGPDLLRLVKREGPLDLDRACDYVLQAAQGLQHIHEHGMVHRDVKPSNLMVTAAGERPAGSGAAPAGTTECGGPWGQVKVLDLGMARLCEEPADGDRRAALTRLGAVMGTVDYMAPEQALQSSAADVRSDVYSLGCTFYMLLAGQPPFAEGDAVEKMMRHQLDPVPPLAHFRAGVPAGVSALLERTLAKRPADRFQTPGELALALANLAAPSPPRVAVAAPVCPPAGAPAVEAVPHALSEFAFDPTDEGSAGRARTAGVRPHRPGWLSWAVGGVAVGAVLMLTLLARLLWR